MFEQDTITHHIARSIIAYLMTHEYARFSDMRPEKVDTNLFSYHLKLLVKAGYVTKTDNGYTLSDNGLIYVDRVSIEKMKLRTQPKIITMLLIQDGYGKVLLQKRTKQPYINTWTLPYGKLHIDDVSVLDAARREAQEKLQFDPHKLRHAGDCYIVVGKHVALDEGARAGSLIDGDTLDLAQKTEFIIETRTLAHVVRFESDAIVATDDLQWVEPLDLPTLPLAPAVEQIVTRAFFGDKFFFEEFRVER
jgi:ADP-ribose pyrophosphatase YjhB (NUDIX family)